MVQVEKAPILGADGGDNQGRSQATAPVAEAVYRGSG